MSENQPKSNNAKLLIMALLGLVAVAAAVFFFMQPKKGQLVTELYRYYPENTGLYVELAPGDQLASRFFNGVDKLRTLSNPRSPKIDVQLSQLFEKDFQPVFGFGSWPSTTANNSQAAPNNEFLAVIPTRGNVTPESLAKTLGLPMEQLAVTKEGDTTLITTKSPSNGAMALHKGNLLTAENVDVLRAAVKEYQTSKTLLDNPLFKDNLGLLPEKRQGTVLMASAAFNRMPPNLPGAVKNDTMVKIAEFQQQMQTATPVMVGSISIEKDQYIQFDTFTPLALDKIKNESFRKDIAQALTSQSTLDMAKLLPENTVLYGGMAGLGHYYDLYANHIATEESKASLNTITTQLQALGLDLRKNIISLFDGKAAIGLMAKNGQPDVLVFLNQNADTTKTMEQLGAMTAQMTGGQMVDQKVDASHSLKVLQSPALPLKVGYSGVQTDTLAVGTQDGLQTMYSIQQKKAPSLSESKLYKELTEKLPAKSSGIFYMDVRNSAALLDAASKGAISGQAGMKEVLGGIEGIAGANTLDGNKLLKGHMTVKLASEQK